MQVGYYLEKFRDISESTTTNISFLKYVQNNGKREKKLKLFTNGNGHAMFHYFIEYIPDNVEGEPVNGTLISIPRVDALKNICVNHLILKEDPSGERQKYFN